MNNPKNSAKMEVSPPSRFSGCPQTLGEKAILALKVSVENANQAGPQGEREVELYKLRVAEVAPALRYMIAEVSHVPGHAAAMGYLEVLKSADERGMLRGADVLNLVLSALRYDHFAVASWLTGGRNWGDAFFFGVLRFITEGKVNFSADLCRWAEGEFWYRRRDHGAKTEKAPSPLPMSDGLREVMRSFVLSPTFNLKIARWLSAVFCAQSFLFLAGEGGDNLGERRICRKWLGALVAKASKQAYKWAISDYVARNADEPFEKGTTLWYMFRILLAHFSGTQLFLQKASPNHTAELPLSDALARLATPMRQFPATLMRVGKEIYSVGSALSETARRDIEEWLVAILGRLKLLVKVAKLPADRFGRVAGDSGGVSIVAHFLASLIYGSPEEPSDFSDPKTPALANGEVPNPAEDEKPIA